jgi:hypothetical protein
MTKTAVNVGAWTVLYTAAGSVTFSLQNLDGATPLKVRIGASVVVGDSLEAAADVLLPLDWRQYSLVATEVVMVQPVRSSSSIGNGPATASVNYRV